MVSFSNGRAVRVTHDLDELELGALAHVHARLQGGVYIATEVEEKD
jgi:hypothetical protein